jgi:hypothetical protein
LSPTLANDATALFRSTPVPGAMMRAPNDAESVVVRETTMPDPSMTERCVVCSVSRRAAG